MPFAAATAAAAHDGTRDGSAVVRHGPEGDARPEAEQQLQKHGGAASGHPELWTACASLDSGDEDGAACLSASHARWISVPTSFGSQEK